MKKVNLLVLLIVAILFGLTSCYKKEDKIFQIYSKSFGAEIIIEEDYSDTIYKVVKMGNEEIIYEFKNKKDLTTKDGFQVIDEVYLVKDNFNSLYSIFKGDYKLEKNIITSKNGDTLLCYFGDDAEFNLPDKILYINDYAFYKSTNLKKLVIGENVICQASNSIYECDNLEELHTPFVYENSLEQESILSIFSKENASLKKLYISKEKALSGFGVLVACYNLEYVEINSKATVLGKFFAHSTVKEIKLPDTLKVVENGAFLSCENLKELVFPQNVEKIGSRVFELNLKLEKVYIPSAVIEISSEMVLLTSPSLAVFCEDDSKKDTWESNCFPEGLTVNYGVSLEEFNK